MVSVTYVGKNRCHYIKPSNSVHLMQYPILGSLDLYKAISCKITVSQPSPRYRNKVRKTGLFWKGFLCITRRFRSLVTFCQQPVRIANVKIKYGVYNYTIIILLICVYCVYCTRASLCVRVCVCICMYVCACVWINTPLCNQFHCLLAHDSLYTARW